MATRRQFVATLVAATAAAAAPNASADPALATTTGATPMVSMVAGAPNTMAIVSSDYTARSTVPFSLSQLVELSNPSSFRVLVQFDSRLFTPGEIAVSSYGEHYEISPTAVDLAEAPTPSTVRYELPDVFNGASVATVNLSLPLTAIDRYPNEGLDTPMSLSLVIASIEGTELARVEWAVTEAPAPVVAWGAEVTAIWTDTQVVNGGTNESTRYRYPAALQCSSVGPASIPVGSTFTVEMDGSVISSCGVGQIRTSAISASPTAELATLDAGQSVASDPLPAAGAAVIAPIERPVWPTATYSITSETANNVVRTSVSLNQEIPAGTAIEIALEVQTVTGEPTISTITYATAFLSGPSDNAYWQRNTGKYLVNDLTASGTPQVTGVAEGKI